MTRRDPGPAMVLWNDCMAGWGVQADALLWHMASAHLDEARAGLNTFAGLEDVLAGAWLARMWEIEPAPVGTEDPWDAPASGTDQGEE